MHLAIAVIFLLFQSSQQDGNRVLEDDGVPSNYNSLDTFKKILAEYINLNGGFESLGRVANNRGYGHLGQKNESKDLSEQIYSQDSRQGNPEYGQAGYDPYYQQNYGYYQGNYGNQNYNPAQTNYGNLNYGYQQGQYYPPAGSNGYPFPYPINGYPRPGQGPGGYQPGFLEALSSITRHDDLRCVPRLLCEVASSGKASSNSQSSLIPFANRDSLVSLLTVLNFVDDSPLMTFGRAALLGYTARGDTRACLQAYPTCPRDPDRLVEYLNNHNGGFFRFFQGAPPQQINQFQDANYYPQNYPSGYVQKYRPHQLGGQYSPQYSQYRILSKPDLSSSSFPTSSLNYQESKGDDFFTSSIRKGKKLSFPDSPKFTIAKPLLTNTINNLNDYPYYQHPTKLSSDQRPSTFFPDRTGTGQLLFDYDQLYNHQTNKANPPYYSSNYRDSKHITFPDSPNSYIKYNKKRMIFPPL